MRKCHNVTGAFQYFLRADATDLTAYKHFHTEMLGSLPQVSLIMTFAVMGAAKGERA